MNEQAVRDKLHEQRYWHLLLHYQPSLFGGHTSEVDDPGFFLSENGKEDPEAELRATISFFFSDKLVGRSQQPAQCAFVARYHWLKEKLKFEEAKLPSHECERFHHWYDEFDAEFISMIFPSAFMGNPASMFGHTFLRVDPKGQTEQTRILAYTINYAAEVPPNPGIEYAYKGVFGGYKGFFSTIPYYMKVKEYGDIENRDIWEYRLNFSPDQIHRLLMHVWELGNAYFDYYFFKENCAYHILSLLEVADPNLHLTDQFHFATIPGNTIRLLFRYKGLVKESVYRPARSTLLKRKRSDLEKQETSLLPKLLNDPHLTERFEFRQLPRNRQIFLLDFASDVLRYKAATDQDKAEDYKAKNRSILVTRSQIKIPSPSFHVEPFSLSPDNGHNSLRVGEGFGWRNHEIFEEISVRAAYHDLLDPDAGYTQDAQIELLDLRLRYYHSRNQFRVERFTFANILSLAPIDSLFISPSWKFNVGMDTVKTSSCDLCSNGNINAGIGGAQETQIFKREVFFLLGEIDANVSGAYKENHRVGGGISGGVMATITPRWKWLISAGYLYYPLGDRSHDIPVSVGQRWTFAKNFAVRATFTHHDQDNEIFGVFHGYF
ncbi:Lnb N-terminal periplasmic domain-containing protein [Nitrospira sp. Ecomares 2.1]